MATIYLPVLSFRGREFKLDTSGILHGENSCHSLPRSNLFRENFCKAVKTFKAFNQVLTKRVHLWEHN